MDGVCVCVCECACVGIPLLCNSDAFCRSEEYTVCLAALNFNTHNASSCQAITEGLLSVYAFGRPDSVFFSFFSSYVPCLVTELHNTI